MRIRLYGLLGDLIGAESEVEAPNGCTVAEARELLRAAHPNASAVLDRCRASTGNKLVSNDHALRPDDVVEFLPPVSGG